MAAKTFTKGNGTLPLWSANGKPVVKIAPDGTQSTFVTSIGGHAGPLALDAAGNLYVGNGSGSGVDGQVYRYAPDGKKSQFANIVDPSGLAFDASGNLFASSSNETTFPPRPRSTRSRPTAP